MEIFLVFLTSFCSNKQWKYENLAIFECFSVTKNAKINLKKLRELSISERNPEKNRVRAFSKAWAKQNLLFQNKSNLPFPLRKTQKVYVKFGQTRSQTHKNVKTQKQWNWFWNLNCFAFVFLLVPRENWNNDKKYWFSPKLLEVHEGKCRCLFVPKQV